jgi:uncharacterized protein YyaL (SSP411 family)
LDAHYLDSERGGYFFTASDASDIIVRIRNAFDNATPSGNGMMLEVLACLYCLTGNTAYRDKAESLIGAFGGEAIRNSIPLASFLSGLDCYFNGVQIVVRGGEGTEALLGAINDTCVPNRILSVVPAGEEPPVGHPARGKTRIGERATAYVCVGETCTLPLTDAQELRKALARSSETLASSAFLSA